MSELKDSSQFTESLGLRTDHLTTDRERLYYRKLMAELLDFLRKNQVHLKDLLATDDTVAEAIPLEVYRQASKLLQRVIDFAKTKEFPVKVVEGTTPEGREITFDLQKELAKWKQWYAEQGVDWVTLPEQIGLSEEQEVEMLRLIEEYGFDQLVIIPATLVGQPEFKDVDGQKVLKKPAEHYRELSRLMTKGYKNGVHDHGGGFDELEDINHGVRIVLYKEIQEVDEDELHRETLNKTPNYLEKEFFPGHAMSGLAVSEYLVIQRAYYLASNEKKYLDTVKWTWFPGSRRPSSSRVPNGYGGGNHLGFSSGNSGNCVEGLGCRLAGRFDV